MAVTRSHKGNCINGTGGSGTLASVTLAAGETLFVFVVVGSSRTYTSCVWNGNAMRKDLDQTTTSLRGAVFSLYSAAGGTGTITLTASGGSPTFIAVGYTEVYPSVALDKSSTNTGTSTTPSTGTTATLSNANELVLAAVFNDTATMGGTWEAGYTNGSEANHSIGFSVSDAYKTVSSTTAVSASKTGTTNIEWLGVIVTYQLDVTSITSFTPSSGATGDTITITGNSFTNATSVKFGVTESTSFTVVNATTITAVVGGGSSGSVSVTTPLNTATLAGFTYYVPAKITGVQSITGLQSITF